MAARPWSAALRMRRESPNTEGVRNTRGSPGAWPGRDSHARSNQRNRRRYPDITGASNQHDGGDHTGIDRRRPLAAFRDTRDRISRESIKCVKWLRL